MKNSEIYTNTWYKKVDRENDITFIKTLDKQDDKNFETKEYNVVYKNGEIFSINIVSSISRSRFSHCEQIEDTKVIEKIMNDIQKFVTKYTNI